MEQRSSGLTVEQAMHWLREQDWGTRVIHQLPIDGNDESIAHWLAMVRSLFNTVCGASWPSADAPSEAEEDYDDVTMWPALTAGLYE